MTPTIEAWSRLTTLTLLHFVWQGALLGLAAFVVTAVLHRRKDARAWHAGMVTVLFGMVVCPMITAFLLAPAPAPLPTPGHGLQRIEFNVPLTIDDRTSGLSPAPDVTTTELRVDPSSATLTITPLDEPESTFTAPAPQRVSFDPALFAPYVSAAYLLGLGLMLVRLGTGVYGGQHLRRTSEPITTPELLESLRAKAQALGLRVVPPLAYCARVGVPTVVGVMRPMILLPVHLQTGLSVAHLELLLLHELAHIRRYDHVINLLQRLAETLLFFHPAVWYVSRQIAIAREHCCDDLVIRGGGERTDYARLLVEAGERASATSLVALGAVDRPSRLRRRIARILETDLPVKLSRMGLVGAMAVIAVGVSAIAVIAAQRNESTVAPSETASESSPTVPVEVAKPTPASVTEPPLTVAQAQQESAPIEAAQPPAPPAMTEETRSQFMVQIADPEASPWVRKTAAELIGVYGVREYIPHLIRALNQDPSMDVRAAAAKALGKLGDGTAVPHLVAALELTNTKDEAVAYAAGNALASFDHSAVMALLSLALDEENPNFRGGVYFALYRVGSREAIELLCNRGLADRQAGVEGSVWLSLILQSTPSWVFEEFKRYLDDPDRNLGALMAFAFAQMPEAKAVVVESLESGRVVPNDDAALKNLVANLGDNEQVLRALLGLLTQGKLSATSTEARRLLVERISAAGIRPDDAASQVAMHLASGNVGVVSMYGDAAIQPLIDALESNTFAVDESQQIIESLGQLGDERAIPALEPYVSGAALARFTDNRNPSRLSDLAIQSLQQIGGDESAKAISSGLLSRYSHIRMKSAETLGNMKNSVATTSLIASLKDIQYEVRSTAARALGEIGDVEAVPALIAATNDPISNVRFAAVRSLAKFDDPRAFDALVASLKDDDETTRSAAAQALGDLGDPRAIEPLVAAYDMGGIEFLDGGGSRWSGQLNDVIRAALDKLGANGHALAKERYERERVKTNRSSAEPPAAAPADVVHISVGSDGELTLDGRSVNDAELRTYLERARDRNPRVTIAVSGYDSVSEDVMRGIIAIAREVGIRNVSLAVPEHNGETTPIRQPPPEDQAAANIELLGNVYNAIRGFLNAVEGVESYEFNDFLLAGVSAAEEESFRTGMAKYFVEFARRGGDARQVEGMFLSAGEALAVTSEFSDSPRVVYELKNLGGKWMISELHLIDDQDTLVALVDRMASRTGARPSWISGSFAAMK